MATSPNLKLKFSTCVTSGCSNIEFTEQTGEYSLSNPGGYGGFNAYADDFTEATLTVISPDNISTSYDLFVEGFPTTNLSSNFSIPVTYSDGKWTFIYTLSDGVDTFTVTKYSYFYCTTECCVTKKLANITTIGCDSCKDSFEEKEYIKMFIMLESLKNAARCGSESTFNSIKKIIDKLCKNNACNTCK